MADDFSAMMNAENNAVHLANGVPDEVHGENGAHDWSDSEDDSDDSDADGPNEQPFEEDPSVAVACDDGCVRIYDVPDANEFVYRKSMPRISCCLLSVMWSSDGTRIYAGSSDGFIRCWDAKHNQEIYRIMSGLGGLGSGNDFCIWSLLYLRCGTLVSAASTGSVQFWDSRYGTLLQAHSYHKGDVNALAASPSHNRVFSAGSDGQQKRVGCLASDFHPWTRFETVVLYKTCNVAVDSVDEVSSLTMKKLVYVGYVRAHTHDVRALTTAVPISREDPLPEEKAKQMRLKKKPFEFSLGVPMLISAGDDTKLFAYSAKEFTKFSPHDICPAPQRLPIQLVLNSVFNHQSLLLVQKSYSIDVLWQRMSPCLIWVQDHQEVVKPQSCWLELKLKQLEKSFAEVFQIQEAYLHTQTMLS